MAPPQDPLQQPLQARMLASGEWDRINRRLKRQLDESGWTDDVKDRAKEECRRMPELNVRALEKSTNGFAHDSIPTHVKADIMEQILQFLKDNVQE